MDAATRSQIVDLLNRRTSVGNTHWGECHADHIDCAAHLLLREVDALTAQVAKWQRIGSRAWSELLHEWPDGKPFGPSLTDLRDEVHIAQDLRKTVSEPGADL